MNKYDKLFLVNNYNNISDSVKNRLEASCFNAPIVLKDKQYVYKKENRQGKPAKISMLSEEEFKVLETIYFGKCITIEQIMMYLELNGYTFSVSKTKSILDKLLYHQAIQRITIFSNGYDGAEKRKCKYYMIGEYTPCKKLGIPNTTMKKLFVLRKECGSSWPLYCISMQIINQIALNQIIYNENIDRIIIGDVRMFPAYKLVIPLTLMSDEVMTVFIFAMYMNAENIHLVLDKWLRFINEYDKRVRLIIISRDDTQQFIVRKNVDKNDFSGLEIGFTNYADWFTNDENRVYIKTSIKAIQA